MAQVDALRSAGDIPKFGLCATIVVPTPRASQEVGTIVSIDPCSWVALI
jgi:hypothetical protein